MYHNTLIAANVGINVSKPTQQEIRTNEVNNAVKVIAEATESEMQTLMIALKIRLDALNAQHSKPSDDIIKLGLN